MRFSKLQKAMIDAVDRHGHVHLRAWKHGQGAGLIHSVRTLFTKTRNTKYHNFSYKCTGQEVIIYNRAASFFEPDYIQYWAGFELHWLWVKSDLLRRGKVNAPHWRTLGQRVEARKTALADPIFREKS